MSTIPMDETTNGGTLEVLAKQVLSSLVAAEAIAIWDAGQNKLLSLPARVHPKIAAAMQPEFSASGEHVETPTVRPLGRRRDVQIFSIPGHDGTRLFGMLSIVLKKTRQSAKLDVAAAIKPILDCMIRQANIDAELSSAHGLTVAEKQGARFLSTLDSCKSENGIEENAQQILNACVEELGCDDGVVIVPRDSLEVTAVRSGQISQQKYLALADKMLASVETERRVVVANVQTFDQDVSMLACPILDAQDRIIGLLCISARGKFSREHARLARAGSARLSILLRSKARTSRSSLSRSELIDYIDACRQRMPNTESTLFYLDMDRLHVINDSFGHTAGDQVIEGVLETLQSLVIGPDVATHLAGDRFVLFCANCDQQTAESRGEAILGALKHQPLEYQGKTVELTASVGAAMMPKVATQASQALSIGEVACRGAKERGGNRFVIFEDIDASMARRRSDLDQVGYLQNALLTNRFELAAQVIAPLSGSAAGQRYELLVRMRDDDGELLTPAHFMSAAERYQMMPALDRWVINQALMQIGKADNVLEINLASFSVNVSAQSLADDRFLSFVETAIHKSQVSPNSICFEITETAAVKNVEKANHFIRSLQRLGCRFALDDFGTGIHRSLI